MNNANRPQLPLASPGCSCCAPASAAEPALTLPAPAKQDSPAAVVRSGAGASARRTFAVEGMTCGHCVRTVETAVSTLGRRHVGTCRPGARRPLPACGDRLGP
ncbi:cation transporter [Arthrobacter sp. SAFR-044]|uniref:cation transporter n=1 Tax=Arthrobacter sp. SAFR-044 TaxID=3387278 RepID=UPI003F7BAC68